MENGLSGPLSTLGLIPTYPQRSWSPSPQSLMLTPAQQAPLRQAASRGRSIGGRQGGSRVGKGPATSWATPPTGGPKFKTWSGSVQASILLPEFHAWVKLRNLVQPHFTSPTSPGLSREHVLRVEVASDGPRGGRGLGSHGST